MSRKVAEDTKKETEILLTRSALPLRYENLLQFRYERWVQFI